MIGRSFSQALDHPVQVPEHCAELGFILFIKAVGIDANCIDLYL
jgi:hypothetical protein